MGQKGKALSHKGSQELEISKAFNRKVREEMPRRTQRKDSK